MKHLLNKTSIYTAEVSANDLPLDIMFSSEHQKFLIYTNFISVLIALPPHPQLTDSPMNYATLTETHSPLLFSLLD